MRRGLALLLVCAASAESGREANEIIGKLGTARYGAFDDAAAKKGGQVVMPVPASDSSRSRCRARSRRYPQSSSESPSQLYRSHRRRGSA